MFTTLNFLIIASANAVAIADGGSKFNYLKQGGDWKEHFGVCGSGKQQSPIDFSGAQTSLNSEMTLTAHGYTNTP